MMLLAIDPGPSRSAWVILNEQGQLVEFGIDANADTLDMLAQDTGFEHVAIEMIACYGMPVGKEVFETCLWIGRYLQAWDRPYTLIYRNDVKMHLCHQIKGVNDGVIRQALIDRFGPGKGAIGSKKAPGPLYGVSSDVWAALGVAVTWWDTCRHSY
jgi:hypothetical protein